MRGKGALSTTSKERFPGMVFGDFGPGPVVARLAADSDFPMSVGQ
jgi:hypothetical protein